MSKKPASSTTRATPKAAKPGTGHRKTARKPTASLPSAPTGSKQSQLIAMLRSPAGGTIEQLTRLTGWQAHTVRGAISGALRKRLGLSVICAASPNGGSVYRIVEAAA